MKRKDDDIDVGGKAPGFWFYPGDAERDVQILSLAAQGLWFRMLGWMHYCERRGFLQLPTGIPMTLEDIAARAGKPKKEVSSAIAEMERIGLFSRDERGCIFNRRMVKDTHISRIRKEAAAARLLEAERDHNGRFAGEFAGAKSPQNTVLSVSVSDSVSSSDSSNGVCTVSPSAESVKALSDEDLGEAYWSVFVAAGKGLNEVDKRKAFHRWVSIPRDQQEAAYFDAFRKSRDGTWPTAELTPMPANHLADHPWTREAKPRVLPTAIRNRGQPARETVWDRA